MSEQAERRRLFRRRLVSQWRFWYRVSRNHEPGVRSFVFRSLPRRASARAASSKAVNGWLAGLIRRVIELFIC